MATVHPEARDAFRHSLRAAKAATTAGVVPSTAHKAEAWWSLWLAKCSHWGIDPIQDPSTPFTGDYLAAFAHDVRMGTIVPGRKPCKLGNVETALRSVGQTIALLGPNNRDPRLQPTGKLLFALKRQLQCYAKEDPPPTRVDPLPVDLIKIAVSICTASGTARDLCLAHMITIGFFFLCRPGEHTITSDNEPFKMSNVQFYADDDPLPQLSPRLPDFLTLTFDTQKMALKAKKLAMAGPPTHPSAQFKQSHSAVTTSTFMVPHSRNPCAPTTIHPASSSSTLHPPTSPQSSAKRLHTIHGSASPPPPLSAAPYGLAAPWPSSPEVSTPCSSNLLAAGGLMPCSATSMSNPGPS